MTKQKEKRERGPCPQVKLGPRALLMWLRGLHKQILVVISSAFFKDWIWLDEKLLTRLSKTYATIFIQFCKRKSRKTEKCWKQCRLSRLVLQNEYVSLISYFFALYFQRFLIGPFQALSLITALARHNDPFIQFNNPAWLTPSANFLDPVAHLPDLMAPLACPNVSTSLSHSLNLTGPLARPNSPTCWARHPQLVWPQSHTSTNPTAVFTWRDRHEICLAWKPHLSNYPTSL